MDCHRTTSTGRTDAGDVPDAVAVAGDAVTFEVGVTTSPARGLDTRLVGEALDDAGRDDAEAADDGPAVDLVTAGVELAARDGVTLDGVAPDGVALGA